MRIIEELNEGQRAAVLYNETRLLVIAGAGLASSTVLTYKIAYLLENGYQPYLVFTFTYKKLPVKMKERIAEVGDDGYRHLW